MVNRNHYLVEGRQLLVPYKPGSRYFDLWRGIELNPKREGEQSVIEFALEPDGYGAVLETSKANNHQLANLLTTMKSLSQKPLSSFANDWKTLPQKMVDIAPTAKPEREPSGMVKIPQGDFTFRVTGIEIEGTNDEGIDVQYPWEPSARRYHSQRIHLKSFWMDTYPVTNADFKAFLDATHYHPADDHNFLKDWKNGTYPTGGEQKARHMDIAGGYASIREVGGQAPSPRMGMAVCRPRNGWSSLSLGERLVGGCRSEARHGARHGCGERCFIASEGREPVWSNGSRRQHLAMDG